MKLDRRIDDALIEAVLEQYDTADGKRRAPNTKSRDIERATAISDPRFKEFRLDLQKTKASFLVYGLSRKEGTHGWKKRFAKVGEIDAATARTWAEVLLGEKAAGRDPDLKLSQLRSGKAGVRAHRRPEDGELTYEEAVDLWLEGLREKAEKDGEVADEQTLKNYRNKALNIYVDEIFGAGTPVQSVTIDDLNAVRQCVIDEGRSRTTANAYFTHMQRALKSAAPIVDSMGHAIDQAIIDAKAPKKAKAMSKGVHLDEAASIEQLRWLAEALDLDFKAKGNSLYSFGREASPGQATLMAKAYLWLGGARGKQISFMRKDALFDHPTEKHWGVWHVESDISKNELDQALLIPPPLWRDLRAYRDWVLENPDFFPSRWLFTKCRPRERKPEWEKWVKEHAAQRKQNGEKLYRQVPRAWYITDEKGGGNRGQDCIRKTFYRLQEEADDQTKRRLRLKSDAAPDALLVNEALIRKAFATHLKKFSAEFPGIIEGRREIMGHVGGGTAEKYYERGGWTLSEGGARTQMFWTALLVGKRDLPDVSSPTSMFDEIIGNAA